MEQAKRLKFLIVKRIKKNKKQQTQNTLTLFGLHSPEANKHHVEELEKSHPCLYTDPLPLPGKLWGICLCNIKILLKGRIY